MLILAKSCRELQMDQLMEIHADSNREKASDWPDLPPLFALELAERDFRQYLDEVFFPTPGAVLALWEENRRYVSALRLEPYQDGLLLEGLETLPQARGKGYASSLIQAVQEYLSKQGNVRIYSHVQKRNAASLQTHKKCGFRIHSDHALYINGSVDYRCYTLMFEG